MLMNLQVQIGPKGLEKGNQRGQALLGEKVKNLFIQKILVSHRRMSSLGIKMIENFMFGLWWILNSKYKCLQGA